MKQSISATRVGDILLGSVGASIPPSQTLDHLVRFFGSWSGNDKALMVAQYGAKLLIPLLQLRAQLQHRAGLREKPFAPSTEGLNKLVSTIGAARRVSGLWGILSIFKWLSALERSNPTSLTQLTIERVQALSMLVFYGLENVSFFSSPAAPLLSSIIPSRFSIDSATLSGKAQLWSIRAWAGFVVLQLIHLKNDWTGVLKQEKAIARAKASYSLEKDGESSSEVDIKAVKAKKAGIINQALVNSAFLPLTIHWGFTPVFKNEIWVDLLAFIAAVGSAQAGWVATA